MFQDKQNLSTNNCKYINHKVWKHAILNIGYINACVCTWYINNITFKNHYFDRFHYIDIYKKAYLQIMTKILSLLPVNRKWMIKYMKLKQGALCAEL